MAKAGNQTGTQKPKLTVIFHKNRSRKKPNRNKLKNPKPKRTPKNMGSDNGSVKNKNVRIYQKKCMVDR